METGMIIRKYGLMRNDETLQSLIEFLATKNLNFTRGHANPDNQYYFYLNYKNDGIYE